MRMHVLLTVTLLEIICVLEESKLDKESVSFFHTCTFVSDRVVPAPQHRIQKVSSNLRGKYRPS